MMGIPVSHVNGIGPKTAEYLATKGINTVSDFLEAGAEAIADAPGFSASRAEQVYEAAQLTGSRGGESPAAEKAVSAAETVSEKKGKKKKGKGKKDKKDKGKKKKKDKKGKKDKKKDDKSKKSKKKGKNKKKSKKK